MGTTNENIGNQRWQTSPDAPPGINRNSDMGGPNFAIPFDIGNYNELTKMPNTKVVGIIFPYILTRIPNLYDPIRSRDMVE